MRLEGRTWPTWKKVRHGYEILLGTTLALMLWGAWAAFGTPLNAVVGMAEGDTKTVKLDPDEAYGQRHDQLVQQVPKNALPDDIDPRVGMALQSTSPDGQVTQLTVTQVDDESITVDANHPLAGQALNFDIELVKIG